MTLTKPCISLLKKEIKYQIEQELSTYELTKINDKYEEKQRTNYLRRERKDIG